MHVLSNTQRCAVITGSSKGIGFGLAQSFLALGWSVVISARNLQQVQAAVVQLSAQFDASKIYGLSCDVTQQGDLQQLWDAAIARFKHVDVWINNAGSCHAAIEFKDIAAAELSSLIQTNILGSMLGSQVALQGMLQQGNGQIFNMEGWGSRGEWSAGMTAYSTTKRAVAYFSKALYKETKLKGTENTATKPHQIRVGTLSPGMVATDLLISSWVNGNAKNWHKMKRLFFFVIDPPEIVCAYLAKRIVENRKSNVRIIWMTPWRLLLRFFQPYYWRRNPVKGTALEQLK